MTRTGDTIRVVIPLNIRKRNGRPKILPPDDVLASEPRVQNPHILKAIGRAWAWRRRLENGEVATADELAKMEGVTERFISRTVRLAYMSPHMLDDFLLLRRPPSTSTKDLITISSSSWFDQHCRLSNGTQCR